MPTGPNERGPDLIPWDEAREIVIVVLTLAVASMTVAPMMHRLIDGQYDRNGFVSGLAGVRPLTGALILAAAALVATTPAADMVPRLRAMVVWVASTVTVVGLISILEILFSESAGGVRHFFVRFPTIFTFKGPATLMAAAAAWVARRVIPFPAG